LPQSSLTGPSNGYSSSTESGGCSSDRAKRRSTLWHDSRGKQQKEKSIIKAVEEESKGQQDKRSDRKKIRGKFMKCLHGVEKVHHDLDDNALISINL
jgi:hypothetical protein